MKFSPDAFINRELSWLEFNQRVLDQAAYRQVPLLERLKFLAISASNLDEFFMVRVGGLLVQKAQRPEATDPTGLNSEEQLQLVLVRLERMVHDQYACFSEHLEPGWQPKGWSGSR